MQKVFTAIDSIGCETEGKGQLQIRLGCDFIDVAL